jgi:aminomethyltransferase
VEHVSPAATPELREAYESARGGSLVVRHEAPGVLRLRGGTALDFLHRMSTNAVTDLEPGGIRGTVLTTAIGRTVDVTYVLRRSTDLLLLTSPGQEEAVRAWLGRYIFYNDDVQIEVDPAPFAHYGVYGPAAAAEVHKVADVAGSPDTFSEAGDGLVWMSSRPIQGYQLLTGPKLSIKARAQWGEHASGNAGVEALEALRLEAGFPAVGREIDAEVIPLEVGLWEMVSFSKGCYIGQEVIARMESRSRIARGLAGVRLENLEETPREILLDQQPIGRLTSVALSPRFGPIGLALVRTSAMQGEGGALSLSPPGGAVRLQPLPLKDGAYGEEGIDRS